MMRMLALAVALFVGCAGPMGPPGPEGPPGPGGAQGPQGQPGMGLAGYFHCAGIADVSTGPGAISVRLNHDVYDFADGSTLATCEVAGRTVQSSAAAWYLSGQQGVNDGTCLLTFDVDAATSGYWAFTLNASSTRSTAEYFDSGSSHNLKGFSIACQGY